MVGCFYMLFQLANIVLVLLPSKTAVEDHVEEEDGEKPLPAAPEQVPQQSADPPAPTSPGNHLPSAEVKRSACLFRPFLCSDPPFF